MANECSVEDCAKPKGTKGLCVMHYARLRRHGNVNIVRRFVGDPIASFWAKVDKSGDCWEWTASKNDAGYGQLATGDGKHVGAHVFSLEMATGSDRPEGMDTCHTCDNPSCVNPKHLYFGTRQQNIDDAWDRGRFPVGQDRHSAKITELDVVAIRNEYAAGAEVDDLVAAYGLKNSTIRCIVLGFKWKHVGGPITVRRGRLNKNKKAARQ